MGDPLLYNTAIEVDRSETMEDLSRLLAEVPESDLTYAERHGNSHLHGSPALLLEAAQLDPAIRSEHGTAIIVQALVRVVADQQRRIEELERAGTKRPKAGATKR